MATVVAKIRIDSVRLIKPFFEFYLNKKWFYAVYKTKLLNTTERVSPIFRGGECIDKPLLIQFGEDEEIMSGRARYQIRRIRCINGKHELKPA